MIFSIFCGILLTFFFFIRPRKISQFDAVLWCFGRIAALKGCFLGIMSKSRTRIKGRQYESVGKPAEGSLLMGRCLVCELWLLPQDQELSALNKGMQELHRLNMALEDKVPPTSSLPVMQAGWGGSLPKIFRGFFWRGGGTDHLSGCRTGGRERSAACAGHGSGWPVHHVRPSHISSANAFAGQSH